MYRQVRPGDSGPTGEIIGRVRMYETVSTIAFGGRRRRVYGPIVALSGARPGDRVLDVGCSGGYLARLLAAAVTPGGQVTGIDPATPAITYARRRAPGNCSFTVGTAQDLGVPDGSSRTPSAAMARVVTGRPLEACTGLFARYGDTVYLPVRPWEGLYILSRPEQAEHVLAANQGNYVKPFTYRPLRMMLGDGLLTSEDAMWRRHRRIIQPVFSSRNVASFAADMDSGARHALGRWTGSQVVDVASEMSALTLDVVGRALFSADLVAQAPSPGRALAAGQWLALLGAFAPIPWGPRSTRVVRAAARRFGAGVVPPQVDLLISRRRDQAGARGERAPGERAQDHPTCWSC